MNEQLLKMNGLSVEILDALSFESHLGTSLKKNLHYFDKKLLIDELVKMAEWMDEQEILSDIALDYRMVIGKIIRKKYESGLIRNEHEFKEVLNNVLFDSERS